MLAELHTADKLADAFKPNDMIVGAVGELERELEAAQVIRTPDLRITIAPLYR